MKKIQILMPFVFFILLLCAAFVLHDDYGGFTDETLEIETAAVNAKYILSRFPALFPDTNILIPLVGNLDNVPDLLTYDDRTYGTAVMLPTIFVNQIPGISLNTAEFLNFRRLYTFFSFFLALICFFFLLKTRFDNILIAMIGTIMLTLTPRIFAESFYNCKDIVFFSWFLVSLSGIGIYLIRRSNWGLILFCIGFGLAANTRLIGFILWPAFLLIIGFDLIKEKKQIKKRYKSLLIAFAGSLIFFYIITPYLWGSPVNHLIEGFRFSSDRLTSRETGLLSETNLAPLGQAELFFGEFIAPKDIWYYLPVWMGITIPLLYLILFLTEILFMGGQFIRQKKRSGYNRTGLFDQFCLALFVGCMAGIILTKTNLYHGWRHAYFLYAPFIYLAACGFGSLWDTSFRKGIIQKGKNVVLLGIVSVSFASTGFWVVKNHPLDFVYFNEIGRRYARQFTRDYWGVASKSCVLDLLNEYDGRRISLDLNADYTWGSIEFSLMRLPEEQQKKFDPVWQIENAEYLCFSYKNIPGNNYPIPDFEILKTYRVDGYDVAAIYKRVSNFKY
ncbi:MAG: hypothetical protein AB9907_17445 [Flexilinea sp.]